MVPEKQINEFVSRVREAAGSDLESVVLYGSAASGDFHPDFSNVNLLCVLRETSFLVLTRLAPVMEWWDRQKHPAPLVLTRNELVRSADVFSIELLDMQQQHRVLLGDDPLVTLKIPMDFHRAQLEYELREKLILLRERLLLVMGHQKRMWELLLHSVSAFGTLFRHALIALGDTPSSSKRDAIEKLAARLKVDLSAFLQVLDVRAGKSERKDHNVNDVFSRYLAAAEQVTAAVDTMLDSPKS